MPSAVWYSLASTVALKCAHSRADIEVSDPPYVLYNVPVVNEVELDAEGEWELLNIPPPGEIDVPSSLPADFSIIRDKGVECSIEAPTTAAGMFKLELSG